MNDQESRLLDSPTTYVAVYIGLMALLGLTVLVAAVDLGTLNLVIALLIAAAKAVLIVLFFMHVRHANTIVRLFAGVGFVWLLILLLLTLGDYANRPLT
jgi:cytochrome c oxidase subunit 4